LRPQVEAFEERDAHTFSVEVDADEGQYVFSVQGLDVPDPDWGLMIGDCLHNARAALDYLMVALVALVTGEEPRDIGNVGFPITDEPTRFPGRALAGVAKKHPAFEGYLTRIEELQPFNIGKPAIWGFLPHGMPIVGILPEALRRLSALDNIDKHRVIHATWLGGAAFRGDDPNLPEGFTLHATSKSTGALENGAEIARWQLDTPLPDPAWKPEQVDMQRYFPIEVAFEEAFPTKGVLEVLPFCLDGVEATLGLFAPVFNHGAAPLPVTATLDDQQRLGRAYPQPHPRIPPR
jgi:hypothetical protein